MNNVSLPSNSSSTPHGVTRNLAWAFGLALCLLVSNGLWAAAIGGDTTCYNCEIFNGVWECDSGGVFGGTECTVKQSSCTVKGNCNGKGNAPVVIDIPQELVQEVAGVDGGAAATLVRLHDMQALPAEIQVSWLSAEITSQDVTSLLAGGDLGSKTPGKTSRFDVQVVLLDEDNAAVVVQPTSGSDAQNFSEMAVFLERDPSTGLHHAKSWFLH